MGPGYYLFAAYVFFLVCAILVICKFMFADVRRQKKLLEEAEKKLLQTYGRLEDAMDEFQYVAEKSRLELQAQAEDIEKRLSSYTLVRPPRDEVPISAEKAVPSTGLHEVSKTGAYDPQAFESLLIQVKEQAPKELPALHEMILDLSRRGKKRTEIAEELKITLTEVDLVIGVNAPGIKTNKS